MGQAVTDAAAWYDKAEWFGVHATPRATILIDSLIEAAAEDCQHIAISHNIPMKNGSSVSLKAVNWPRGFHTKGVMPCKADENKKAKLLQILSKYSIPSGAERKYTNSINFFDTASVHKPPKGITKKQARSK